MFQHVNKGSKVNRIVCNEISPCWSKITLLPTNSLLLKMQKLFCLLLFNVVPQIITLAEISNDFSVALSRLGCVVYCIIYRILQTMCNQPNYNSLFYVDPVTGVQTNSVESMWNDCKRKFRRMVGCKRNLIPSYLDVYLWRKRHARDMHFDSIVNCIRHQYSV